MQHGGMSERKTWDRLCGIGYHAFEGFVRVEAANGWAKLASAVRSIYLASSQKTMGKFGVDVNGHTGLL
jgi:hypothetical protein